jgi:hypothetical protein
VFLSSLICVKVINLTQRLTGASALLVCSILVLLKLLGLIKPNKYQCGVVSNKEDIYTCTKISKLLG